jgi:hypothetical protein
MESCCVARFRGLSHDVLEAYADLWLYSNPKLQRPNEAAGVDDRLVRFQDAGIKPLRWVSSRGPTLCNRMRRRSFPGQPRR